MGKGKPRFPFSLYQMGDSGSNEIGWSSDGASFWVNNPEGLASRVIPNFFDHASYPSFTRSLNAHGFLKLTPRRGPTTSSIAASPSSSARLAGSTLTGTARRR